MASYQYRKSHCGDKTILQPYYLHNGISYTGKMASLYWIRVLGIEMGANCEHDRCWCSGSDFMDDIFVISKTFMHIFVVIHFTFYLWYHFASVILFSLIFPPIKGVLGCRFCPPDGSLTITLGATWAVCTHATWSGVTCPQLRFWGWEKMSDILQETFSNAISLIKTSSFIWNSFEMCSVMSDWQ